MAPDAATEKGMDVGRNKVSVGAGDKEIVKFTVRSDGDHDKVVNGSNAETDSNSAGYTADATPPAAATGVLHGHTDKSGMVDQKYVGDAGPLARNGIPVGTVSSDGKRVGVHEVINGKLQFRMIRGTMTLYEQTHMQDNVNSQQELFYEPSK